MPTSMNPECIQFESINIKWPLKKPPVVPGNLTPMPAKLLVARLTFLRDIVPIRNSD